ncbi:hypothetical protein [Cesiribacter sp. SM1]|uniref:hypothetical protein n=1 Tax=Cesiribacter sp. SM1 TaxID=2861196 RepID=UPI001CD72BEA|nr:hypothetical protein [Cesiribacter sp. SM1]
MKKLFFISLLLCLSVTATAQLPKNEIRLSAGILDGKMLDLQASPLVYHHQATAAAISYARRTSRARFTALLSPALGTNLPFRYGERTFGDEQHQYTVASAYYGADLSFSYLRSLSKVNKKLKLFLGGRLENKLAVSDAVANFYWATNVAALQAQLQGEYKVGSNHLFSASVSTPLLAAVTRHNYANFPKSADDTNFKAFFKQGTVLTGPHRLHELATQAGYRFQLSSHFAFGADWGFRWLVYSKPRAIRTYSNSFLFSTAYTF